MRPVIFILSAFLLTASIASPQNPTPPAPCVEDMPGMKMCPDASAPSRPMAPMDHDMMELMQNMRPQNFIQQVLHHSSSGTTAEPNSTPTPMMMAMRGKWMFMFHGNGFITDTQQSSPRGGDKFYSTNWFMPMAQRNLGPGQLTLRAMFSLEPATVTGRQYPLLFQQGETAFGKPIADGQHPHDFLMEIAALYDFKLGSKTLLSFYAAPMGDPAIGPTAYPHRASALENPVGTLGHHQEDSTHIAADVLTVGLVHTFADVGVKIEASGFHGREPDEFRWDLNHGAIDSWSTRITVQPGQNWSGQYSYARVRSPEDLHPDEDQARTTASVMYNRKFSKGNWANTALWGRTRALEDNGKQNSYLLESLLRFKTSNYTWLRMENASRTDELENAANPALSSSHEEPIGHVQSYTFGYDHDVDVVPHLRTALGAQVTTYGVPDTLKPLYGSHPVGVSVFLRLRPFGDKDDR